MSDAPKLLPCPFCGSKYVKAGHGVRYAECLNCDSMGPTALYPDNAISAWNTRADHAQAEKEAAVAAEREACAQITELQVAAFVKAEAIRARTDTDAQAALEAVKREARNEVLREALALSWLCFHKCNDEVEVVTADDILSLMRRNGGLER